MGQDVDVGIARRFGLVLDRTEQVGAIVVHVGDGVVERLGRGLGRVLRGLLIVERRAGGDGQLLERRDLRVRQTDGYGVVLPRSNVGFVELDFADASVGTILIGGNSFSGDGSRASSAGATGDLSYRGMENAETAKAETSERHKPNPRSSAARPLGRRGREDRWWLG